MSELLKDLATAVIEGDLDEAVDLTEEAIDDEMNPAEILNEGLMQGMDYVGVQFKAGDMFVPEVLRSARAMQGALELLRPLLAQAGTSATGKVLLGTVKGDLHDIGKNLVGMMCEGAGFEVKDIGKDISPEGFVDAIKEYNPDIVGMSALLTTTMRVMGHTIKALEEAGLREQIKVMIGGAPVTQAFSDEIGADGYASNAASAAELAKQFMGVA